ncbi:LysR family transcriptional regulator [Rhodospirillum sp. A1_3_36]|uniref:LysR family transcriptional regulator n=1 Tax=Rhodospirillum sp. A1_3_36 TaxID=3391666 RepID=UPI0039A4AF71
MTHLTHLRTFLDVYRSGSITQAARRLGITQPAASAHVAALEEIVGHPLFFRRARGVTPTPAADDLAQAIAGHLDGIEAAMGAVRVRAATVTGTVHVIGPAEYLSARVAETLAPLIGQGLHLRIQTGNRTQIRTALAEGHVDLALLASPPDGPGWGFAEVGRERLIPLAAPEMANRLKGRPLTAELLRELPCVAYDESLPLIGPFVSQVFGVEADMTTVATAPDLRLVAGLARSGAGWTVLPDYLCAEDLSTGRLTALPIDGPGPENTLYLAWNKAALRHPRVVHARDFLLNHGRFLP